MKMNSVEINPTSDIRAHSYLSFKVLFEEDIGGFDVPMDDFGVTILV